MSRADLPARELPLAARAPAKCILFGEHAVVRGGPELVAAIDLHTQVGVRASDAIRLNRDAGAADRNPYLKEALARGWGGGTPVEITSTSRIPRSAGLGSSAAFSTALTAAFGAARGGLSRAELAARAFAVERGAQGVGSPGDTSAIAAGGLVSLNADRGTELWKVSDGTTAWTVREVPDPSWSWIVAYSGIPRDTAETVRMVTRRFAQSDGPTLLDRFKAVAVEGINAVIGEDPAACGRCLDDNQELLRGIGVSHPRLEALLESVRPVAHGAKLTGAGAGGSIVALPRSGRELEAVRRIARAGGVAFVVRVEAEGARLVEA